MSNYDYIERTDEKGNKKEASPDIKPREVDPELLKGADLDAASSGQVPTKQADGSMAMESGPKTPEKVRVNKDSDQSLSSGSTTVVTWDTEETAGNFDLTNDEYNPPEDGWYFVHVSLRFPIQNDQQDVRIQFREVGGGTLIGCQKHASGSTRASFDIGGLCNLLSSNSYEVAARIDANGTIEAADHATFLSIHQVV